MNNTANRAITRRVLLRGFTASAAAAILAACGESVTPTSTVAPVATVAATRAATSALATTVPSASPATTATGASPAVTAVAATQAPAGTITAALPASPSATATSPTVSAMATVAPSRVPTGPIGTIALPAADKFKGQTLQMLSRTEYFKETEKAQDVALQTWAQQLGIKVENNRVDVFNATVVTKEDVASKSGRVEDLIYTGLGVSEWKQLGDLIEVSDVVAELEAAYGPVEDVARTTCFIDGKWWGIPYYGGASGWFARQDWLDEKGIKLSELKTLVDLRDAALAISDPSKNRFGWGLTINQSTDANSIILDTIYAYGGSIASNDGKKVVLNSPETIEGITVLADFYTNPKYKNMLPPGINSWSNTGNNEGWLAGVLGFTRNAYSLYAQAYADKNPVYEKTNTFAGFTGPGTDRVITTGSAQYFVILKGAKNVELAKATAKYLAGGPPLLGVAKTAIGQALPVYKKQWDSDPFYTTGNQNFPGLRSIIEQELPIKSKTGYVYPQEPSPGKDQGVNGFVLTDMMGQIVQKSVKPADAVKDAHARFVKAFEQLGLKQ